MILSLKRDVRQKELGTFAELVFDRDEVRTIDATVVAIHAHNRWREDATGETFLRLEIIGPLIIFGGDGEAKLGPYLHFSCVDGVSYVEQRVFGFWDLQHRDWYIVDLGLHWKSLKLRRAGV